MKAKLQRLARMNGQLAKIKAGRLAVMLRLCRSNPKAGKWLQGEAMRMAKSVAFHLRQADLIGRYISQQECKPRQVKHIDPAQAKRAQREPVTGTHWKA